jgi:hypothetical protein
LSLPLPVKLILVMLRVELPLFVSVTTCAELEVFKT